MRHLSGWVMRCVMLWVKRQAGHRRTVVLAAAISWADYFLPILPNEGMAVALGLVQRRSVVAIGLAFALASALGAAALAWAVGAVSDDLSRWTGAEDSQSAQVLLAVIADWGLWVLAAAAVFPSPPRAMVIASALAGLHPVAVGLCVLVGKLVLYTVVFSAMAWLLHRAQKRHPRRSSPAVWRAVDQFVFKLLAYRRWLSRNIPISRNPT